ncbi:16S rRNA C967 or C1407 C5-methylase (RsmB/RsmF family) [Pontibacter ummariensis]|uniref:16S rRNA C967 or C1407 C5-methylase, RsmB/RsmF family n=1 Tax=Pontibacter ummariensis TaxID=1610492 RepID=A0A239BU36_9BACT|nr:rRNA methyltransferase [Pontibacter ummariensis]PRY15658.1 16S rRNA C967 or C1407 C5-methylase (RsmB/RsmF family) [Pontibacter ummariensis]SNS10564.1 16S rRNA C967 or C1407 C5-methylase, RsmB/RsmF family [Pontibacter ummariensis]
MELPISFTDRMQRLLGPEYKDFLAALQQPSPVSIRLNKAKFAGQPALVRVPWASHGYYLPERPSFTLDPLLHAGAYYVQEASSMFLEQALRQAVDLGQPLQVLDLCGAPGGKSTHIASLISKESLLVSNEVIRSRASILAENIMKWGAGNVLVTSNDPRDFGKLPNFFDVMVVDAPCSGEGMFRKDVQAISEWSDENVNLCAQRQQRILMDVWEALKPGGVLVYSTCTWNEQENEQNIAWLADQEQAESIRLNLEPAWGAVPTELNGVEGYRFYPHRVQGEGFFMAVVRKAGASGDTLTGKSRKKKYKLNRAGKKEQALVQDWLLEPDRFEWVQHGDVISALPAHLFEAADEVYQQLYVVYAGIEVAEVKGKKLKPLQGLALSQHLHREAFAKEELSLEQALRYLRKEDISVGGQGSNWLLLTYQDLALGWAKQVGNRLNNYYPKEWRIRMELPQDLPEPLLL